MVPPSKLGGYWVQTESPKAIGIRFCCFTLHCCSWTIRVQNGSFLIWCPIGSQTWSTWCPLCSPNLPDYQSGRPNTHQIGPGSWFGPIPVVHPSKLMGGPSYLMGGRIAHDCWGNFSPNHLLGKNWTWLGGFGDLQGRAHARTAPSLSFISVLISLAPGTTFTKSSGQWIRKTSITASHRWCVQWSK